MASEPDGSHEAPGERGARPDAGDKSGGWNDPYSGSVVRYDSINRRHHAGAKRVLWQYGARDLLNLST
jgi:hypothetical protein